GHREAADDALRRLLTVTVAGSDWSAGVEARSRALLSAGADAEHWYTRSIDCLARTPLLPELARTHLVYGEWLRRDGRRVDARRHGLEDTTPRLATSGRCRRSWSVGRRRLCAGQQYADELDA